MVNAFFPELFTMNHFKQIGPQLFYSFPIQEEERIKLVNYLDILESSGVWKFIFVPEKTVSAGRPPYDPYSLFAAILLGFSIGKASLREIETSCKNDLRFIFILGGECPSYATIARFIQEVITPHREAIFSCIMKAIFARCKITMDTIFLDGTKQQAKANKYKFVWKPTTYHERLSDKVRSLLKVLGLEKDVPTEGFVPASLIMKKIEAATALDSFCISGGEKALSIMRENLSQYLLKTVEYEEKEAICGPNRQSYYKTDHDATAMCLKQDYYSGLGSNMHAAYSAQILVAHGFIVSYLVSQDRSDLYTLKPTLESFHSMYDRYPKKLVADSGYGNLDNYEYCEKLGIQAFVKYQAWNGESSGRSPAVYELLENGDILCLGRRIGHVVNIENRHPKKPGAVFYLVQGCNGCDFMPYCRRYMTEKEGDEKYFEVQRRFILLKQKARNLLLTPEGIELRVNRSCQVEGAFGIIKQGMMYSRFRRTSLPRVTTEFALTCLGMNIRKFMRFSVDQKLPQYWVAPKDLSPGKFKKPSAKRLANRINKRRMKQPNEIAKASKKKRRSQNS